MSWRDIIKEEFKDEQFAITINGNSVITGTFDNADLRFGMKQSQTFGKVIELLKKNKKAYDSYTVKHKNNRVVIDIKYAEYDEDESFEGLIAKIMDIVKKSKYVKRSQQG